MLFYLASIINHYPASSISLAIPLLSSWPVGPHTFLSHPAAIFLTSLILTWLPPCSFPSHPYPPCCNFFEPPPPPHASVPHASSSASLRRRRCQYGTSWTSLAPRCSTRTSPAAAWLPSSTPKACWLSPCSGPFMICRREVPVTHPILPYLTLSDDCVQCASSLSLSNSFLKLIHTVCKVTHPLPWFSWLKRGYLHVH